MSAPKRRSTSKTARSSRPARVTGAASKSSAKVAPRLRAPDETRAALVAAAARLFLRDGLDVPSLDAICEEAGKTRGAFYVHFKSREDLVAAVVELALTELLERIVRPDQDLATIVRSFVAALSAGAMPLSREVRFSQVLEASMRSAELRVRFLAMLLIATGRIADAIERSIASGSVDPARDPHALAEMLLAIVLGVQAAAQLEAPYDASGVERELLAMLAPPGARAGGATKKARS